MTSKLAIEILQRKVPLFDLTGLTHFLLIFTPWDSRSLFYYGFLLTLFFFMCKTENFIRQNNLSSFLHFVQYKWYFEGALTKDTFQSI